MGRGMQENHINIYQKKREGGGKGGICVQTIVTQEMEGLFGSWAENVCVINSNQDTINVSHLLLKILILIYRRVYKETR